MRRFMVLVLLLSFFGAVAAGAQEQQTTTTTAPTSTEDEPQVNGFIPDGGDIGGIPSSNYRFVYRESECGRVANKAIKLSILNLKATELVASGGSSLIVGSVVDGDKKVPSVLCPDAVVKNGTGTAAGHMMTLGRLTVTGTTSVVESILSLEFIRIFRPVVKVINDRLNAKIVGPLRLRYFAISIALIVTAFLLVVRGLRRGIMHLARTVILVVLSGIVLSNPLGAFDTLLNTSRDFVAMASSLADDPLPSKSPLQERRPLEAVRDNLVRTPWEQLNFGGELPAKCLVAANQALKDDLNVIEEVAKAGCPKMAEYSMEVTGDRFWGAAAYMVLSLILSVSLLRLAFYIFASQVTLGAGIALAPIMAAGAPAMFGDRAFVAWGSMIIRALVGGFMAALVLAAMLLMVGATMTISFSSYQTFFQMALAAGLVLFITKKFRQFMESSQQSTHHAVTRAAGKVLFAGGAAAVTAHGLSALSGGQGMITNVGQRLSRQGRQLTAAAVSPVTNRVTPSGRQELMKKKVQQARLAAARTPKAALPAASAPQVVTAPTFNHATMNSDNRSTVNSAHHATTVNNNVIIINGRAQWASEEEDGGPDGPEVSRTRGLSAGGPVDDFVDAESWEDGDDGALPAGEDDDLVDVA